MLEYLYLQRFLQAFHYGATQIIVLAKKMSQYQILQLNADFECMILNLEAASDHSEIQKKVVS